MRIILIQALAGAGKTTALAQMARQGDVYVAFNRSLAREAEAKVGIKGRTFHSLALEEARKALPNLKVGDLNMLSLKKQLNGTLREAVILYRGLNTFLLSGGLEPGLHHLDPALGEGERKRLLGVLRRIWRGMLAGELPMPHDGYLKFWTGSQIKGARALVDEAQDLSPRMIEPLKEAGEIVAAGDPNQQIYAWRGAVNALSVFRSLGEVQEHTLNQSYRFGPNIARYVRGLAGLPLEGRRDEDHVVDKGEVKGGVAVVLRTNSRLLTVAEKLVRQGYAVEVVGGLPTGLYQIARAVDAGLPVREVMQAAEVAPELKPAVRLLQEKGAKGILSAYRRIQGKKAGPRVVLSTVHRAKGLEWDHVVLGDDFPKGEEGFKGEELRLRYVAATRARRVLDVGGWHGKSLAIR